MSDALFDNVQVREIQRLAYLEALSAIRREVDTVPSDFIVEVAKGRVPGHALLRKFGRNVDTDPAADATAVQIGRDVWDGGIAGAAPWVPPTTARTHQIASSDDEDGGAGTDTGALTLKLFGLDENFHLADETITLTGVTDAPTARTYTMIYRMQVLTAGSTGSNVGDITATADTDATVTAQITALNNQTLMAIYQIPANTTAQLIRWSFGLGRKGAGAATFADGFLMAMDFGEVWRVLDTTTVSRDGQNWFDEETDHAVLFPAKSYVKIVADPSATAQDTHGDFDLLLVDDGR